MSKIKKKQLLIVFIGILLFFIALGSYYLYVMKTHQSQAAVGAGNLVIVKDYYIGNGTNPVAKHVYIIRDKYTDNMYINIDTLDANQKPITAAFGPYYESTNNIMTYTQWMQLNDKKPGGITNKNINIDNNTAPPVITKPVDKKDSKE